MSLNLVILTSFKWFLHIFYIDFLVESQNYFGAGRHPKCTSLGEFCSKKKLFPFSAPFICCWHFVMFLSGRCCNTAWYPAFRLLSLLNPSRFMPTALVPLSAGQTSHILPVWPQCTLKRSSCHWIFKRVPSRAEQEVWNGILLNDQSLERKRGHKYLASTSIYLAGSICLIGGWCVPHVGEIKFLQCHMLQWAQTFILWGKPTVGI